jgi:zona occludens toxin (predicted ATPase)
MRRIYRTRLKTVDRRLHLVPAGSYKVHSRVFARLLPTIHEGTKVVSMGVVFEHS